MKIKFERERLKIFFRIGIAFCGLWVFSDLFANTETFFQRLWNNVWLTSYLVILNYIAYESIFPYITFKLRRLLIAPFLLFGLLMLYSFGFYAWRSIGVGLNLYFPLITHKDIYAGVQYHVTYAFSSLVFFGIVRHIYDYRKLKEATQQLKIEKQEAELNYLKSQTNPHFLFNTLNNIYSLARDKSDLAPDSILRLSKILRFMLYETNVPNIAVEQELQVISDYIALEKLRYDNSLQVNFNRNVEDMKQSVPPLLLIPLVENAFKHGVSETRNQPFVEIHLTIQNRMLTFIVKNSADPSAGAGPVKENIGLSNLRRQLQLLYRDYNLSTQQNESVFTSILTINLSSRV
ncbi:MAG TPA: histidine kinase [Chryseolinea sp.]|nr:histidine kinase [Chryseolinea sp.]